MKQAQLIPKIYQEALKGRFPMAQGMKIFFNSWQSQVFGFFNNLAVTWNEEVHFTKHAPRLLPPNACALSLLAHELVHVEQQLQTPWLIYLARYSYFYLAILIRRQDITEHPLEAEAYQTGEDYYQKGIELFGG